MDIYIEEIKNEIYLLSDKAKILLAALTSDILYPHYVEFQNETAWGNSNLLDDGIKTLFSYVINPKSISLTDTKKLIDEIDLITPDTEDFTSVITSFALNACTSVLDSLEFLMDKRVENIINVVTYARDTVDAFIFLKNELEGIDTTEELIDSDPLMIAEKERQFELVSILKTADLDLLPLHFIEMLSRQNPIIDISILN